MNEVMVASAANPSQSGRGWFQGMPKCALRGQNQRTPGRRCEHLDRDQVRGLWLRPLWGAKNHAAAVSRGAPAGDKNDAGTPMLTRRDRNRDKPAHKKPDR